ncbi:MAG TPA: CoA transferase [Burkholderiaceae bacterium]|nr:CoA transferase [Burkholderiaceae bacterium]
MKQARNLDATTKKRQPLPFEGLQVLDISQGAAGPYCAHMLWQQGAQVTKVEPPAGDWSRGVGVLRDGISSLTIAMNGGKQGLCVDASTPAGQQIVRSLAERADVIVENFRPGVAARLGLDPKEWCERRPELIFVSISGYGTGGPYAGAPATDSVVQADAGLMFCNRGDDATPRKIGVFLADINAGLYSAQAVGAALYRRRATGRGEHIEINLFDTCAATLICNYAEHGLEPEREARPVTPLTAPNATFRTRDGAINLVTMNDEQFERLCDALGRPGWKADERFQGMRNRVRNVSALNVLIAEVVKEEGTDHWSRRFTKNDVLHAPVRSYSECIDHPQAKHLNTFERIEQPGLGELSLPGSPVRSMRRGVQPAPYIGQDSLTVLQQAGFSSEQIDRWIRDGVVVQHPRTLTSSKA